MATSVYLTYSGGDTEKSPKLHERDERALNALKLALKDKAKPNKGECFVIDHEGIVMMHLEDYRTYFNATCKGKNKTRNFDLSMKTLKN